MADADPPRFPPIPADTPRREIIARSIYRLRPFVIAQTSGVMAGFLRPASEPDFDGAPTFYRQECYELADGIIYDLALAEQGEVRS
ncbi:MAG: hypothetical protein AB7O91_04010 [Sphingomonas sp.]